MLCVSLVSFLKESFSERKDLVTADAVYENKDPDRRLRLSGVRVGNHGTSTEAFISVFLSKTM